MIHAMHNGSSGVLRALRGELESREGDRSNVVRHSGLREAGLLTNCFSPKISETFTAGIGTYERNCAAIADARSVPSIFAKKIPTRIHAARETRKASLLSAASSEGTVVEK